MPRPSRWNDIVDAAARAFREKGFAATSLEDIATEVGIWKGSLYHYIDSKEDLLFAVVRGPAEHVLGDLRSLEGMDLPPAEKLRRAVRSHVTVLHEHFTYSSVYLQEIAGRHRSAEWSAMDREYLSLMQHIVGEGVQRGDFDPTVDPFITTLAIIGSLNWLTHWYQPEGRLSPLEIADRFSDLFLAGMLSRGAVTPAPVLESPSQAERPRRKGAARPRAATPRPGAATKPRST